MTGLMSCCRFDAGKGEAQGGQVQEGGLLVSVSVDGWDGPGDPGETLVLRLVCVVMIGYKHGCFFPLLRASARAQELAGLASLLNIIS